MLAFLAFGLGFAVMGSRAEDNLREANKNLYKAQAALAALPLTGTDGLLAQCVEASIVGKDDYGRDSIKCKKANGKTIRFSMP
jgi:hypothetical protein